MRKEIVIISILFLFLFVVQVDAATLRAGLKVELSFDSQVGEQFNVSLDSLNVGNFADSNGVGNMNLTVKTFYENGSLAENKNIKFSFNLAGSIMALPETTAYAYFNYYPNLEDMKVYMDNEEKLSVDIPSDLCNNNQVCDSGENYLSCNDCSVNASDGICYSAENKSYWEDGVCDSDCNLDNDCYSSGLSIGDTSKRIIIYKNENEKIHATILCKGNCNNVQAELIQESVQLGPEENRFIQFINRIKIAFGITGNVILNPETKNCGNLSDETCQLSWDVLGDNTGEYNYYVQVISNENNVDSDLIGLTVLSPGTNITTTDSGNTNAGGNSGGGGGASSSGASSSSGGGGGASSSSGNQENNQEETPQNQIITSIQETVKKTGNYWIYGIIILLVIIISLVVYFKRRNKNI